MCNGSSSLRPVGEHPDWFYSNENNTVRDEAGSGMPDVAWVHLSTGQAGVRHLRLIRVSGSPSASDWPMQIAGNEVNEQCAPGAQEDSTSY